MPASFVSDGETATGGHASSETSEDTSQEAPRSLIESGAPESTPAVVATIGDDIPTPPDLPKRAKVTEAFVCLQRTVLIHRQQDAPFVLEGLSSGSL